MSDSSQGRVEATRAEDLAFLRSVADSLPAAICRWFPDTTLTYANRAYRELFGGGEDIVGRRWLDFIPESERPAVDNVLEDLRRRPRTVSYEHEVRSSDGLSRVLAWTDSPVSPFPGEVIQFQSIGIDVTPIRRAEREREVLEAELRQVHQMETLGRLAGGVAHDFNNLLGVILGRVSLAIEASSADPELRDHLLEAREAAERSADLVHQLLAFARKQVIQPRPLVMNEELGGMLPALARLLGEGVQLHWEPGADLPRVALDPGQLRQVMEALVRNARDALEPGGHLSISTAPAALDEEQVEGRVGVKPGRYLRIRLEDTGFGMDAGTMARLFEPFFTTRAGGERSGLGLAAVYGVVRQNGGFVDVRSAPGVGTTFDLHFPALPRRRTDADGPDDHPSAEPLADPGPDEDPDTGPREQVLLVEDDDDARRLAARLLETLGFGVTSTAAPHEALAMIRDENGVAFDLLITDLVMPDMHGGQLLKRVRAMRPDLPCLVISGYPESAIARHGMIGPGVHLLPKPFTAAELRSAIDRALDRSSDEG